MQGGMFVPYDLRRICGRCCVCRRVAQIVTMLGVSNYRICSRVRDVAVSPPYGVYFVSRVHAPSVHFVGRVELRLSLAMLHRVSYRFVILCKASQVRYSFFMCQVYRLDRCA